jgi:LacI family transcriptional regulator
MTVSNVVRGRNDLVKLETRERVEESIARLNYRPNLSARNLRLSEDRSVGLVIADSDPAFLADPFISRLVSGLSNHLSSRDYTLDVQGVSPERFERATILKKAGNDALCGILCGPRTLRKKHFDYLQRLGQPVILFQESFRANSPDVAIIRQNDYNGGLLLARHLLRKSLNSLIFLRPILEWSAVEQREKGIRSLFAKEANNIEISTLLAPSEGFEDVFQTVRNCLSNKIPDAIAAATDSMAAAALKACNSYGMDVPNDILITGFNGFDVSRCTQPTLTTVVSPAYAMGGLAGEFLMERLSGDTFPKRSVVMPVSLQTGQSA